MTKTIPSYLRIHRDSDPVIGAQPVTTQDCINRFWDAYSDVTGWRIDQRAAREEAALELLPAVTEDTFENDPVVSDSSQPIAVISKKAATRLAESASQLTDELRDSREAVRRQEVELALRAAILIDDTDRTKVADEIEATLSDAAAACRCDAAVLYMLDDNTEHLRATAVFGLPPSRLERKPRSLRGSRADLEAMVKGVVTIDDLSEGPLDTWNSPEPFAAGICAVVLNNDVPIGTVWFFRNETTNFGVAEGAAARLAARALSMQLADAVSSDPNRPATTDEPIAEVTRWQFDSLPIGAALAEDWRVDGMIESPNAWATGWHTWDVLPDGTLMLAMAEAVDQSARGAMHAAIARAALAAHTGYRHTPAQLMQRISDTLWQTSTGEQLVSMLYARVDPETGEGEVASAGSIAAMIGSSYGFRPLADGNSEPLTAQFDANFSTETFHMQKGETLLAYSRGMSEDGTDQRMLGDQLRSAMEAGDTSPLARIRREMAGSAMTRERGAATLLREM